MKKQRGVTGAEILLALMLGMGAVALAGGKLHNFYRTSCESAGFEWTKSPASCTGTPWEVWSKRKR